jgi:putative ABC transport system permease protein
MNTTDVLRLSFRTVRSNKLRTGITISIIALGIMALIGIITAIQAMNQKLTESFSTMGANGFSIRFKERNIHFGGNGPTMKLTRKGQRKEKTSNLDKPITEDQAEHFVDYYNFPSQVSISAMAGNNYTISYG